jgi:eukaryotic-like serine/threonine-protein kinase
MSSEHSPAEPSLLLRPGAQVGPWHVVGRQGFGGFGIVYCARRAGEEHTSYVALKLARYPWDCRFAREAELLARIHHPGIPRLLDQGVWRQPSGAEHPYLVMEWVEGTPLYEWAWEHAPSGKRLLGFVAQLAGALAATHAAQALHRDVKGSNIRVRREDGRPVLLDFGSGHLQGAARLTGNGLPPGTDAYRSPESWLFQLNAPGAPVDRYEACAADDLYALGVTLYRFVTHQYPPALKSEQGLTGIWRVKRAALRPLLERYPGVEPVLREWLLRLLSLRAEERGTAAELAEAMEGAAAPAEGPAPKQAVRREPERARRPWRALAAVGLGGLFVWSVQGVYEEPGSWPGGVLEACASGVPEPETVAVGDSAPGAVPAAAHPPAEQEAIAQEPPPKPHPRQVRPDEKGKCPGRKQVAFSGACWVEQPPMTAEECMENGLTYYKGRCYAPTTAPPEKPQPTSSPADSR